MEYLYLIVVLNLMSFAHPFKRKSGDFSTEIKSPENKKDESYDQDSWKVKLDINFSETLINHRKPIQADVSVKYEVNINLTGADNNVTKEDVAETVRNIPIDYIMQNIKKNIDTQLLDNKENTIWQDNDGSLNTKSDMEVDNISTKINKNSNNIPKPVKDTDVNTDTATQDFYKNIAMKAAKTAFSDIRSQNVDIWIPQNERKRPCQEYTGNSCKEYLKGRYVFIPFNTTLFAQELKVKKVMNYISWGYPCRTIIFQYVCHTVFPICQDLLQTYNSYRELFSDGKIKYPEIIEHTVKICKEDCEELPKTCESDTDTVKTYGIELNNDHCQVSPADGDYCSELGIPELSAHHNCVWGEGYTRKYLGRVNISVTGLPCLKWTDQDIINTSEYELLSKQRNYCRNPGGIMSLPWCVVDNEGEHEVQLCDIPQCL